MINEAQEASEQQSIAEPLMRTPFDDKEFQPFTFIPDEEIKAAVCTARKLLAKRNNQQCVTLAQALVKMKQIIDAVERKAAMESITSDNYDGAVWLSEGKALMLWSDKFDLSNLKIPGLKVYELFAIKVLMMCVNYTKIKALELESVVDDYEKCRRIRLHHIADTQTMHEIIDCLARAEIAELYASEKNAAKMLGSKGGKGRTNKCSPLISISIKLYLKDFQGIPILAAANSIEAILKQEAPELLNLSKAKNKAVGIQNWIRKYVSGQLKIPITI